MFSDEDTIYFVREARKHLLEVIDLTKNRWSRHLADRIHQMANNSRDS